MSSDVTGYEAWTSLPFVTLENITTIADNGEMQTPTINSRVFEESTRQQTWGVLQTFRVQEGENQNSAKCARKCFGIRQMFWTRFGTWAPQKYRIYLPTFLQYLPLSIYRGVTSCVTIAKNMGKVWYFSNLNWSYSKHTHIYPFTVRLGLAGMPPTANSRICSHAEVCLRLCRNRFLLFTISRLP